ncbi:MAG: CHAT domain-containing protein [Williamsia sp.]|nr:CHAT domain-containing protein [Williamsia sp.]
MKKLVKKVAVLTLIFLCGMFANIQDLYGQSPVPDTLKHLLTQIAEKSKGALLTKTVHAIQAAAWGNRPDDSLSKKLLLVDSLLINTSHPDPSLALPYATLLVQLLRSLPPGEEHPDYVTGLSNLGLLHYKMGQYNKALSPFREALAIRKRVLGEEDLRYATSLNSLAVVYNEMGQFDQALPLSLEVSAVLKKLLGEQHPRYASTLNNLAALYRKMGQYNKALVFYQDALSIKKRVLGEQHPEYASSLNNLAYLYNVMGQYEKALPLYEQALAIEKKVLGEEHPNYANSLNNLAYVYSSIGQYNKALPLYEQALAIQKKTVGEDHPDYASSLSNLSNLYSNMGQYEKALPLHQQAILILRKVLGETHPSYAASVNNLANLLKSMKQYQKALPLYEEALAIKKKILGEAHPDYALCLSNLAQLYQEVGQHRKAISLLQQSVGIYKKAVGEDHPDYAFGLNSLGLSYAALGNTGQAFALFSAATELTLKKLTQTYSALSEAEKLSFLDNESYQFNYLPSLLFTQTKIPPVAVSQVYTTQLALKGMVLEDQQAVLRSIRKSGDTAAVKLYEQWRSNKAFIGRQLLFPIARRISRFDSLQEATNRLEQQLSTRTVAFRNQQQHQAVTAQDIARRLQKGEVAIEFISFKLYRNKWTDSILYAALVVLPQDTNARFVPLCEERTLERLLAALATTGEISSRQGQHAGAANSSAYAASPLRDSLYQLLWQPLEQYLANTHTIYFAPAGLLNRIAFQALEPAADHFLLEKYQLNQVLSTRALVLSGEQEEPLHTASLWGNISYNTSRSTAGRQQQNRGVSSGDTSAFSFNLYPLDSSRLRGGGWDSLPFSKEEIDSVQKVLVDAGVAVTISSGTGATEEAFKALDGTSPQILHLATHGFFLPPAQNKWNGYETAGGAFGIQQNPLFRSGLVLAGGNRAWTGERALAGEDGILTAYETAQLDLSNTRLAILSACGTALGDIQKNEGIIGLQRALKMAGVKQMIVSLWDVPDKGTSELMALFYHHWLGGSSARTALRLAQLAMKEKYPAYFWAAFVLVE